MTFLATATGGGVVRRAWGRVRRAGRRAGRRVGPQAGRRAWGWIYDRGALGPIHRFIRGHKIPAQVGHTRKGWAYIFGQALVFVFLLQVVTGTALAMHYIPSPEHAWDTLHFLNDEVVWGGLVRGLHFFGASAMALLVFVHMSRVFLTGSYKYPREINWITGVVLFFLTMAMAFTGQLLRWDEDGVNTVVVAATMAGRFPFLGDWLMELIMAGDSVGGATLSRFFAFHVIIFPLLIFGVMGLHVYLVLRNGISEPPEPGRPVDKRTYRDWYESLKEKSPARYWPDHAWREMIFVGVVFASVLGLALAFGPKGPGPPPDPAQLEAIPDPDWFFLWYYALVWYKPPVLDELVLVWLPVLLFPFLILLPILFGGGERAPGRRPWAVFSVGALFLLWATLTWMGARPYWVPEFDTEPQPEEALADAPEEAREGARVFYDRGCQFCHVVLDEGGRYGPELTDAHLRLSPEEMTVRILVGIRNMPAYPDLTPHELERILAYLRWASQEEGAPPGGGGGR